MAKEVIAIDMDDVIVDTAPGVIAHYEQAYGVAVPLEQFYSKDFENVWKTPDGATAVRRVNKYLESPAYHQSEPIQEAADTIRWLKDRYELYIVTGRPSLVEEATHDWLKRHFPDIFERVVFTNSYMAGDDDFTVRAKGDVCLELGATTLIDDNLEHALSVSEAGLNVLLFGSYPWNQASDLPKNIQRVAGWQEVKEYFSERD